MQFERLVVIRKAQITQIDPHLEVSKPIEFRRKLGFEKAIVMLTAPDGIAKEKNLAPQAAYHGIFNGILMLFATITVF